MVISATRVVVGSPRRVISKGSGFAENSHGAREQEFGRGGAGEFLFEVGVDVRRL
jgi:hypothetical protein